MLTFSFNMKTNEFIATIRKGNNVGTLEVTIPPKFHRVNGLVLGKDYIFSIKEVDNDVLP